MSADTLADALPKELARNRTLLGHYLEIGPAGAFGAAFIKHDISEGEKALASGDVIAMLRACAKLKENEG
jgi:hypothetical protein